MGAEESGGSAWAWKMEGGTPFWGMGGSEQALLHCDGRREQGERCLSLGSTWRASCLNCFLLPIWRRGHWLRVHGERRLVMQSGGRGYKEEEGCWQRVTLSPLEKTQAMSRAVTRKLQWYFRQVVGDLNTALDTSLTSITSHTDLALQKRWIGWCSCSAKRFLFSFLPARVIAFYSKIP